VTATASSGLDLGGEAREQRRDVVVIERGRGEEERKGGGVREGTGKQKRERGTGQPRARLLEL
jgi:hypothetical protein